MHSKSKNTSHSNSNFANNFWNAYNRSSDYEYYPSTSNSKKKLRELTNL